MNLPLKQPSQGGDGNSGGVGIGVPHASSEQSFTVGAVGFGPHWNNAEDAMAASIIRLECQKDELNAETALLREQARIMQRQIAELREEVAKYRASRLTDEDDYVQLTDKGRALLEGLR